MVSGISQRFPDQSTSAKSYDHIEHFAHSAHWNPSGSTSILAAVGERAVVVETPYLVFLGDAKDALAAKTGQGIVDWRPDAVVGQLRLPGCRTDLGVADVSIAQAVEAGTRTFLIGVVNPGGVIPERWQGAIVEALEAGLDVASGLHTPLASIPRHSRGRATIRSATPRGTTSRWSLSRRDGPETNRETTADRRHRLCGRQEVRRARHRTRTDRPERRRRLPRHRANGHPDRRVGHCHRRRRSRLRGRCRGGAVSRQRSRSLGHRRRPRVPLPSLVRRRQPCPAARHPAGRHRGLP